MISIGLASVVLAAASAPATAGALVAAEPDPRWAVEQGIESARTELVRCAASATTEPCVRAVYRVCEREHGLSTHAMTDCTVYVERAAEAELSDAERRARLWIKKHPRAAKAEVARQVMRTQAAWKLRAVRACELETGASKDGALYQFRLHRCLADRFAARTLELETAVKPGGVRPRS